MVYGFSKDPDPETRLELIATKYLEPDSKLINDMDNYVLTSSPDPIYEGFRIRNTIVIAGVQICFDDTKWYQLAVQKS